MLATRVFIFLGNVVQQLRFGKLELLGYRKVICPNVILGNFSAWVRTLSFFFDNLITTVLF